MNKLPALLVLGSSIVWMALGELPVTFFLEMAVQRRTVVLESLINLPEKRKKMYPFYYTDTSKQYNKW